MSQLECACNQIQKQKISAQMAEKVELRNFELSIFFQCLPAMTIDIHLLNHHYHQRGQLSGICPQHWLGHYHAHWGGFSREVTNPPLGDQIPRAGCWRKTSDSKSTVEYRRILQLQPLLGESHNQSCGVGLVTDSFNPCIWKFTFWPVTLSVTNERWRFKKRRQQCQM